MKELIYTGVFAALGILLIVMLVMMFLPGRKSGSEGGSPSGGITNDGETSPTPSSTAYIPGIYTTELVLGGEAVDVEVIVSSSEISSIRLVNLNEAVTTMYPLLQPTFDSICEQVYQNQSLDNITYTADSKYTSLVLLEAIRNSLNKASAPDAESGSENTGESRKKAG